VKLAKHTVASMVLQNFLPHFDNLNSTDYFESDYGVPHDLQKMKETPNMKAQINVKYSGKAKAAN
jgi:hypothetical protein